VYCFVVPPSKISCHWLQPVVDDGTFLSPEFIRRKILEGTSPDAPNFSAVREHCPPENHSLFATRHSLPFSAEVGGYENKACYLGCALRVES